MHLFENINQYSEMCIHCLIQLCYISYNLSVSFGYNHTNCLYFYNIPNIYMKAEKYS